MATECEVCKKELLDCRQELQAVNHHRDVLRNVVGQLENTVKSCGNSSDTSFAVPRPRTEDVATAIDMQQCMKQCARWQARSNVLEEVVTLYRNSVLAIYPNGSTYGASQFSGLNTHKDLDEIKTNDCWIEHQLSLVSKSYATENHLLELELQEIYRRYQHEHAYSIELKKKFEENTRLMYRYVSVYVVLLNYIVH